MSNRIILIVDDDVNNRDMLEHVLQAHDFEPISTNSGDRAIPLAQRHQPALILADINMPGINGFDLSRAIRADSATQHIPILLISGLTDPDEQTRQAIDAGANGLIERGKPISVMIERISSLLPDD